MSVWYFVCRDESQEAYQVGTEKEVMECVESFVEEGTSVDEIDIYKVDSKNVLKIQMTLAPVAKI